MLTSQSCRARNKTMATCCVTLLLQKDHSLVKLVLELDAAAAAMMMMMVA